MQQRTPVVILGAGPAGLGLAFQLARRGVFDVTVIERNPVVGGNAGSFDLDGLRVDYGSHRLHPSCPAEVMDDIQALLGADLLDRPRHGRIRLSEPLGALSAEALRSRAFASAVLCLGRPSRCGDQAWRQRRAEKLLRQFWNAVWAGQSAGSSTFRMPGRSGA